MEKNDRLVLIEELFHAALALEPDRRVAFLDNSCASDPGLHMEVLNLISLHERPGDFLDSPAYQGGLHAQSQESSLTGRLLGHYHILDCIGTGGMGKVYRARDTRLDRSVAIKVLHAETMVDLERKRRFVQEAKAASALNHPGIVTIHDIGQAEGIDFIAMEYITGRTLNELIRPKGLPTSEILKYAEQIADALTAAHAAGIVHRDLKPANIMITERGLVKLLDFGLAKLTEPAAVGNSGTPQMPEPLTEKGTIPGTVAYMSPEQARGEQLDARTDLFSLGIILYEMATGQQAFRGNTSAVIFNEILNKDSVSPVSLNPEVPEELERVINKALEKDRDLRFQSASEICADLKRLKRDSSSSHLAPIGTRVPATKSGQSRSRVGYGTSIGAVLTLLVVLVPPAYRRFLSTQAPPFERMEITRVTDSGKASVAAISPDGKYVAHAVTDNGKSSLWLRHVVTGSNVQILPPAEGDFRSIQFSRDGNSLYYRFLEKGEHFWSIYRIPILGGDPRKVYEAAEGDILVSISPDEKRLALTRFMDGESILLTVRIDGSEERQLGTHSFPELFSGASWSPDGKTLVYSVTGRGRISRSLKSIPAEGGPVRSLGSRSWFDISPGAWLPDGHGILYEAISDSAYSAKQIWNISYPEGIARRITNDLNNYTSLSISGDSRSLAAVQNETTAHIWVVPVGDPARARQISKGRQDGSGGLAWTGDDKIIFGAPDSSQIPQIWITATDGTPLRKLTADSVINTRPAMCGNNQHLLYISNRAGDPHIWRSNLDGSDARQLTKGAAETELSCSYDGTWLIYGTAGPKDEGIWRMPIGGGNPTRIWGKFGRGTISPDGKWVLINEQVTSTRSVIIPATGGSPVKTFDQNSGLGLPRSWSADGHALLYVRTSSGVSNIWQKPLDGGEATQLTQFDSQNIVSFDISRDGKRLAVVRSASTSDVVLIQDLYAK